MAEIIDGKKVAAAINVRTAAEAARLTALGVRPGLAVVLVGEDPASATYVRMKERDAESLGFASFDHRLQESTTQEELEALIERLNGDPAVHGILVQLPLPGHLDPEPVIDRISAEKDVDGFGVSSLGRLVRGLPGLRSCTPAGVMELLRAYDVRVEGARTVVIGRSTMVGKPMALLLLEKDATVTVCHSRTRDLADVCRQADILVAAVGRAEMVRRDWVKPGAVVIDVGTTRVDGRLVGDVAYEEVSEVASKITPVPGGVGPMTRAMLMANTVAAAAKAARR
ncbi:MAG TPA: bifunctional methylenetetrahydrofolate dehydrogenase/methenyltetrahydrofolate cyclohydrolase FolD [Coriobacteriia bacterium]|jgi:methylenetetrahydrofolate dehydrogenase (NADP+)/methenyltetrahydrofolate cyclohydrolase